MHNATICYVHGEKSLPRRYSRRGCEESELETNLPAHLNRQRQPMAEDGGAAAAVEPNVFGCGAQMR